MLKPDEFASCDATALAGALLLKPEPVSKMD